MPLHRLNDLYVEELVYLHNAERTLVQILEELQDASSSQTLQHAFGCEQEKACERREHVEEILKRYGIRTSPMPQRSIEVLVAEIHRMIGQEEDPQALDAALIGFVQRFVHQSMEGYASARAYATKLGDTLGAAMLARCIEDEERVESELTQIALDQLYPRSSGQQPRS